MQVSILYNNQNHEFKLPKDANAGVLMDEITKKFEIPREKQKIICRGKSLNIPDPLSEGMKIFLLASVAPKIKASKPETSTVRNVLYKPQIIDTLREPQHRGIINAGLPEGFIATSQFETAVLPKVPFIVKNTEGVRTTISFESDALFSVADDGKTERIYTSSIKAMKLIPIDQYPGYMALGMMTENGNRWFYFVPSQYQKLIRAIL
ncbi:hypothetical protein TVAG_088250 [Trichomonas vaginalis G3]|uniref:UBFD1 PH-like C-terminal domain-containing protein n=1 Tax=Trichomonas vaginalis (strain ATCC PRA-98 / G3) TaxID=412133 RepID=A2FY85_TRIV3|nr:negative regulation of ER-associated ubiquitin-dependent protein catabolic process [Trichomonas vaginalis G3]EAX90132.1 hypothetical protein TVAG_088250 [Trichomonas vaginalis G3]KAI5537810.1 negative regulation of ER-associated ubiquitin-dependent protein catabolic process [Trichomonas vaginalis G3]|eukprot:XP_001303062.1 hypothetical protein [Trichomonas vaginalis G3]